VKKAEIQEDFASRDLDDSDETGMLDNQDRENTLIG
jgi:hypothetical protein